MEGTFHLKQVDPMLFIILILIFTQYAILPALDLWAYIAWCWI